MRAQFLLLRSVPANVVSFRFFGQDSAGSVLYGPVTVPKAAQVELTGVPVQVVRLVIEYLDAQGETVGFGSNPVTLAPGQTFTVNDPPFDDLTSALEDLTVEPVSSSLAQGRTRQFTARGVYADQSVVDLTSVVAWSSDTPAVATVGDYGLATAVGTGVATVTATYGSFSTNATLTVTNAGLVGLQITPDPLVLPLGLGQQLTATGLFSDGSQQDLTGTVTWSSADPGTATVDSSGQVSTVAAGQVVITATDTPSGVSADRTLVVTDAELASLAVTPADPSIAGGTTQQFTATGTCSDGSTLNLSSAAAWSSSAPGALTVSSLVVDTTRDILYVANDGGSVSIYANASTTDAPAGATATISGGNTRLLSDTDGAAFDTYRDELYVATASGGNRICIFTGASTLVGSNNIAPARVLEGTNFGVSGPGGMFLYLR